MSSGGTLAFIDIDRSQAGSYTCRGSASSTSYPSYPFISEQEFTVIVHCEFYVYTPAFEI